MKPISLDESLSLSLSLSLRVCVCVCVCVKIGMLTSFIKILVFIIAFLKFKISLECRDISTR